MVIVGLHSIYGKLSRIQDSTTPDKSPSDKNKNSKQGAKKVIETDKEVVGLMSSHLQRKRARSRKSNATPRLAPVKVAKSDGRAKKSVADDYDKFMSEISDLQQQ